MKTKTMISLSPEKKQEDIFCIVYFVHNTFFKHLHFISMYSALNTLSEYTYQKTLLYKLLLLVFKIVQSLQCILEW